MCHRGLSWNLMVTMIMIIWEVDDDDDDDDDDDGNSRAEQGMN